MKCPKCGETSRIREKDNFCHKCGFNFKTCVNSGDNSKKIFVPHELKTIEVDVEKKIFRVNGEDFGKNCDYFSISCDANNGWMLRMDIHSNIILEEFARDTGALTNKKEYQKT